MDLRVRGKGRKERVLTLWKVVADSVRAWLAVRGEAQVPELRDDAALWLGHESTQTTEEYLRVDVTQRIGP